MYVCIVGMHILPSSGQPMGKCLWGYPRRCLWEGCWNFELIANNSLQNFRWHNSTFITKLLNWCVCFKNIYENTNFLNNLTFLDLYPWVDAFMKLWSKWCMLIWGRALIRTWALVQGNTVRHLAKDFFKWVISLMIIFSKITVRALISSNLQSPITRIGDSSWSFNSYALESTQLFLLQRGSQ